MKCMTSLRAKRSNLVIFRLLRPYLSQCLAMTIAVGVLGFSLTGCIRLFGQAGYVKQTPAERTERVVGFDSAKAFESQQAKGSVTS